ncbi:MAG: M1 family peptidase, partial [Spirosomataceae bacterium]
KKQLTGSEKLTWRNTSADNITELRFHLYLNAFKDENSTFMKESDGGKLRGDRMDKTDNSNWGNIQITSFKTSRKENLYGKMRFIQPDDLNENDETVMQVKLDRPILPNEMIELYIDFKAKLPKIFARTGFAKGYFLVAQWFPKIGVYESAGERYAESGQWNCHQFHANTEFYADFGNYDVRINVPQEFVIGGTGSLVSEIKLKNNRKLLRFYAEDVHDFAWT